MPIAMQSSQTGYETREISPALIAELAEDAEVRLEGFVSETPLFVSDMLCTAEAQVAVKDESHHPGGSFKDRGAGSAVIYHTQKGERLFVTTSAGNHGRGLARAAMEQGTDAKIVLPHSASTEKRAAISEMDARLTLHGANFDEALKHGQLLAKNENGRFIHPYADPLVMAGQATIGLELLRQSPDMTHLVLPVGGGGMLAGVASVIKEYRENVEIIAAQVEGNTAFVDSLDQGRPLQSQPVDTRLEGIAVGNVHPMTFNLAAQLVDRTVIVDRKTLYRTIGGFRAESGKLLETAGAVSPAAASQLANTAFRGQDIRLVSVASGANAPQGLAQEVDMLS